MADETTIVEVTPDDSWFEINISKKVKTALKSGFMTDLTVELQDGKLQCHSLLLAFASPMLAAMIRKSPHEFKLSGVTSNTFKNLLRIIYNEEAGEIKSNVNKILDVAKAAYNLKIFAALTYCTKLLREILDASNVCSILELARLVDHLELKEACTNVIREKTDKVLASDGFLKCDVATLEHILKQEVVHNSVMELDLFQATVRWANTHPNPRQALGSSLSLIRFRTFTTKDVAAYVKPSNLLTEKEEQGLLWYLLAEGKGEMPAGFSNEMRKRHTICSAEHIPTDTTEIDLYDDLKANKRFQMKSTHQSQHWEAVDCMHILADNGIFIEESPICFSINQDIFLIGFKYYFILGFDDVVVTLKDENGTLIATTAFKKKDFDNVKFPHAIGLRAEVKYELHFSSKGDSLGKLVSAKQFCVDTTTIKITVTEDVVTPITTLVIAPKSQ